TPTGSTLGVPRRRSARSSSYSLYATDSPISLTAMTRPESLTNRTTCRLMPRGSAARFSAGHSSSGMCQGRSSSAGSGAAAVICRDRVIGTVIGPPSTRAGRPAPSRPRVVRGSVQPVARGGGEGVQLTGLDRHPDRVALARRRPRVDAHDDLRLARAGVDLAGGRAGHHELAVGEGVGAELLDEHDLDRDRALVGLGDDVERLGTEPDRDVAAVL